MKPSDLRHEELGPSIVLPTVLPPPPPLTTSPIFGFNPIDRHGDVEDIARNLLTGEYEI